MKKQTEYISDGNFNYLRINYGEEGKTSYTYRMLMENTIKGLLPCRTRMINGDTYLFYEVQSKQTLQSRYEIKEINYEALKNLFSQLCILGRELEKYLLDLEHIVFNERYIFQNVETGETDFMFLPNKAAEEDCYAEFMEYIVKRIDHRDIKAVQISYRLYDLSRNSRLSVNKIWELFEEQECAEKKKERNIERVTVNISQSNQEALTSGSDKEKKNLNRMAKDRFLSQFEDYEEWEDCSDEDKQGEKTKWRDILLSSVMIILFTILLCVKISVRMTYEEETMVLAGMAVDAAVFFLHMCYKVWNQRKKGTGISDGEENKREEDRGDILEEYREIQDWKKEGRAAEKERFAFPKINGKKYEAKEEGDTEHYYEEEEEKDTYGETVFLEPESENVLYGQGKFAKTIIQINKFPFTIGKLEEEADYILKDNSISRIHARFYQDKKEVYILDLNSTNGTCKNGFRIPANQKVLVEEGDELTFGKIRFHYR